MSRKFDAYPDFDSASDAFAKIMEKYGLNKEETGTGFYFYAAWYKEDPRLPSNPSVRYKDEWKKKGSWDGFFKRISRVENYYSFEEAVQAIQQMRHPPKTFSSYRNVCKKIDPRLPFNPVKYYEDFDQRGGWDAYLLLGQIYIKKDPRYYGSAEEAKVSCKRLFIINEDSYRSSHWRDKRLPPDPIEYYGRYTFKQVFGRRDSFK